MRWWPAGRLGSCRWGSGHDRHRRGRDNGDDRRRSDSSRIARGRSLDLLGFLVWRAEAAMSHPLTNSCKSITNLTVGALNSDEAETSGDGGGN